MPHAELAYVSAFRMSPVLMLLMESLRLSMGSDMCYQPEGWYVERLRLRGVIHATSKRGDTWRGWDSREWYQECYQQEGWYMKRLRPSPQGADFLVKPHKSCAFGLTIQTDPADPVPENALFWNQVPGWIHSLGLKHYPIISRSEGYQILLMSLVKTVTFNIMVNLQHILFLNRLNC